MTMKEKILHYFRDINYVYNDCTKYETLKSGLEAYEDEIMGREGRRMDKIDMSIMISLELIRDECTERKHCEGCPYSCKYYIKSDEKRETRYACVLKEIPENWQLETMEGLNDGC
mgnify:CR=1 FL=1